ncbi:MAG: hypothetical protein IJB08_06870 [Alistipes sp.]|nr:hypothetical protein [Alistipes sp.]
MKRIIAVVATAVAVVAVAQTPDAFEQFRRQMDSSFESVKRSNNENFERRRAEIDRQFADHMRKAWETYNSSAPIPEPERPEPVTIPEYVPKSPTSNEHPVTAIEPAPKPQPVQPVIEPKPQPKPEPTTPVVAPKPEPVAPVVVPKSEPTTPVVTPKPEPKAPVTTPTPKPVVPVAIPKPEPKPQPATPVVVPTPDPEPATPAAPQTPNQPKTEFSFFGTHASVSVPEVGVPMLFNLSENTIADAWMKISSGDFEQTLADCLAARKSLALGDWGYYTFVKEFTNRYYEAECNDGVLLQAYVLAHSGYKVRMARSGNHLMLLLNFSGTVYGMSYFKLDGVRFYVPEKKGCPAKMSICEVKFPGEQSLSLQQSCPPRLAHKATGAKTFKSKRYPEVSLNLSVNKNLMDFYSAYPSSDFAFYVHTSLSDELQNQLYPTLRRATAGKSQRDAVSIILNFVQTAFSYQTDDQQFNREKWFFGDETFYYPYSDCDDRAILFSVLVRDVLNMEAVLLDYPNHLAAAVRFNSNVEGDYVTVDGTRFVVCDPTYVGAGVGVAMPDLDTSKLKIVKL